MRGSYDVHPLKVSRMHIRNYTYVVVDRSTDEAAIVDPAWELDKIEELLGTLNVKLRKILLTHSHDDHVNLVEPLVAAYGAQVYMSAAEIAYYGYSCPNLTAVGDRDVLFVGRTPVTCLLTPGHTAGGVSYLLPQSLFTGDTVFTEGCGICTTVGGDPHRMYESIQRIKADVDPDVRVYPGHSFGKQPGHTLGHLLENNLYFQLNDREHFISFRMRKNQAVHQFQ